MDKEYYMNLWRWKCGLTEKGPIHELPRKDLYKSEWDFEYEELRHNRMIMGAFRYGQIEFQDFTKFDLTKEAHKRINLYEQDGNLEHLVDAGNMCMLAFIQGKRMGKSVNSIDDGLHSEVIK